MAHSSNVVYLRIVLWSLLSISIVLACRGENPRNSAGSNTIEAKRDYESINRGQQLFQEQCGFCHRANSTAYHAGPGLKGILKKPRLPTSNYPATVENILKQLKNPYKEMPSFQHLTDEELSLLIAYLNTL